MEFEDILLLVGSFGRFQRLLLMCFTMPISIIVPFYWMNLIFYVSVPPHWCYVEEIAYSNLTIDQQRRLTSPPSDPSCSMYNLSREIMLKGENFEVPNDTEVMPCTNGWRYDKENYEENAAIKWDMVCESGHVPGLLLSLARAGRVICTPIYGMVSDKFGRKMAFLILAVVVTTSELASVLVNDVVIFAILRAIQGGVMPSLYYIPFVLTLEFVTPNFRGHINGLLNFCSILGLSILPLVAYLSRNWVNIGYISSAAGVFMICFWRCLPESPSWLISKGRYEEALEILVKVGETNKMTIKREELRLKLETLRESLEERQNNDPLTTRPIVMQFPRLRKHLLILTFCWTALIVSYNGVTYNIANLNGNEFFNFFLLAVVEFPGNFLFWFYMNRVGRRWTVTGGFFVTTLICLLPTTGLRHSEIVSSLIGKFIATGLLLVIEIQLPELFPTVARSFFMGIVKTVSTAATIFLPYIVYLSTYGRSLPFVFISVTCLAAGVASSFLPETLYDNLPQTVPDAENLGREQKFFSLNRRKKSNKLNGCKFEEVRTEVET